MSIDRQIEKDYDNAYSDREREVLELIGDGHTQSQVAEILDIGQGTVAKYKHRADAKRARAEYFVTRYSELIGN